MFDNSNSFVLLQSVFKNTPITMELLNYVNNKVKAERKALPPFIAGDTITVHFKIKEGEKERIQQFQGVVLQRRGGSASTATFTVRKMSGSVGVERIFPEQSPFIDKIEVNKRGTVRRARIFYLRGLKGKSARIKERIGTSAAALAGAAK